MKYRLFLFAAIFSAASAFAADARIAFVNTNKLLEQAPQADTARTLLQNEFSSRDAHLVAQQKKLRIQEERLAHATATMGNEERLRLERDIASQQRELKRSRDEFTEDLNIRRNEEFARLQREVASVIVQVAKELDYDLVLESGVVYASDRVDITPQVLARLKKNLAASNKRDK